MFPTHRRRLLLHRNDYFQNTVITLENPLTAGDIITRIEKVKRSGLPWLVAEKEGEVIGYAYATKWNERSAYRHTVEVTAYLSNTALSEGWGTKLYEGLFDALRHSSIRVAVGGITLPNLASIALHEKFGMEKVAHFKSVGYKFGKWLDVGYWQVQIDAE